MGQRWARREEERSGGQGEAMAGHQLNGGGQLSRLMIGYSAQPRNEVCGVRGGDGGIRWRCRARSQSDTSTHPLLLPSWLPCAYHQAARMEKEPLCRCCCPIQDALTMMRLQSACSAVCKPRSGVVAVTHVKLSSLCLARAERTLCTSQCTSNPMQSQSWPCTPRGGKKENLIDFLARVERSCVQGRRAPKHDVESAG